MFHVFLPIYVSNCIWTCLIVFCCNHVINKRLLLQSDPIAVVYAKKDEKLVELARTEVIMNTLDPVWIVKVPIAYQFEIVQPLV